MKILTINYFREVILNKWFWLLISITLLGIFLFSNFRNWAYDDPFITYRYAENLRKGLGFVYNPGEKILSTTTPLFTLLLAFIGYLWSDLHFLANLIGVISLLLGGVFLWDLSYTNKTPLTAWACLLLYPTFPLLVTTLGSETPIYLCLCIGSFAFYARQKYIWVGLFSSLAILTRPDGVLIPIIIGLDFILRRGGPIPWKALIVFLVITISWFVFAQLYFGSPIPVTLVAKQNQGAMAVSQKFAPGIITITQYYRTYINYWIEAILAIIGLIYILWRARQWILYLIWPVMYFLIYSMLGVSRYFWYYAPLVPGFIVILGVGIAVFDMRRSSLSETERNFTNSLNDADTNIKEKIFLLLAILLIIFLLVFQINNIYRISKLPDTRYQIYRAAGEWLLAHTFPGDQIGALEVGIIGYYSKTPMVDFAGLIQPEVAQYISASTTYEDAAIYAIEKFKPKFLVLISGVFPKLEELYIHDFCHSVKQLSGEEYGFSNNIDIYKCKIK